MAGLRRHLCAALTAALGLTSTPAHSDGLTSEPVLAIETGGHSAKIWAVDAAAGLVASAGDDKAIRLWDAETGALQRVIYMPVGLGDVGKLIGVALAPDGEMVAAGGVTRELDGPAGQPIQLFLTRTGEPLATIGAEPRDPDEPLAWPQPSVEALDAAEIGQVQAWLARIGLLTGATTGQADHDTLSAARRFAAAHDLAFDGTLRQDFADALRAALAAEVYGPHRSSAVLPRRVHKIAFSPDGRYLAAPMAAGAGIAVFDRDKGWSRIAWDRGYADNATVVLFLPDGALVATSYDGAVRRYAAGSFLKTADVVAGLGRRPASLAISPDGRTLAVGYEDTTAISMHDPDTLAVTGAADTGGIDDQRPAANLSWVAFLPDGRFVAAGRAQSEDGSHVVVVWDGPGVGQRRTSVFSRKPVSDLVVSLGGLFAAAADPKVGRIDPDSGEVWRNIGPLADFRAQERELSVSADGSSVAFGLSQGFRDVVRFDLDTFQVTEEPDLSDLSRPLTTGLDVENWDDLSYPSVDGRPLALDPYEDSRGLSIKPDLSSLVIAAEGSLRAFTREGELIWAVPVPGDTRAAVIVPERDLVVAAHDDGTIRWYRLDDGQLLLSLFVHARTLDWVLWTPEGYFTSSAGGGGLVGWRVGGEPRAAVQFYPVSEFMDGYRRPDLVRRVLAAGSTDGARTLAEADAAVPPPEPSAVAEMLPPKVEIGTLGNSIEGAANVSFPISLDPGSAAAIEEFQVWVEDGDGRYEERARAPVNVTEPTNFWVSLPLDEDDLYVSVTAQAGEEIFASDRLAIDWGKGAASLLPDNRVIHVLAVGVGRYAAENLSLKWADKDAADFTARVLEAGETAGYHAVRTYPLVNEKASREGVIRQFSEVREAMQEGDIAMILFSGHGVSEGPQYYLLPFDTRIGTRADLVATSVPYSWMRDELRGLAAKGPTLLFLDACRSGSISDGVEPLDVDLIASDLRRPDQGARNRGVIVFASSSGGQLSLENDDWENGAFTKALLEAFDGTADEWGTYDHATNLDEIKQFVEKRVYRLTDRRQKPQVVLPDPLDAEMVLFTH